MEEEYKYFWMGIPMRDNTPMENLKAMEFINGKMGQYIKASSKMVSDMDMDSGHSDKRNMKGSMWMIEEMDKDSINGEAKVTIRGISLMIRDMDLGKCIGIKTHFTEDNGTKVFNQDQDSYGKMEKWSVKEHSKMENSSKAHHHTQKYLRTGTKKKKSRKLSKKPVKTTRSSKEALNRSNILRSRGKKNWTLIIHIWVKSMRKITPINQENPMQPTLFLILVQIKPAKNTKSHQRLSLINWSNSLYTSQRPIKRNYFLRRAPASRK